MLIKQKERILLKQLYCITAIFHTHTHTSIVWNDILINIVPENRQSETEFND